MVMVFFLFVINIIYIWYFKLPIIKSYIIVFLAVYIALNFLNVDTLIAKNNIRRYFDTGKIDMAYLKELSYDAIPQIHNFYVLMKNSDNAGEVQMSGDIMKYFSEKESDLKKQKSWQSFNISKYKAEIIIEMTQ